MPLIQKIKKHPYYSALAAIVIIGGLWYWNSHRSAAAVTKYVTSTVSKQTIISSVNGTGQVSTLKRLDIKPQTSGTTNQSTVKQVSVVPGQVVKSGQLIAKLDDSNVLVSLEQAQASLASAQANYSKVMAGTTQTDLNSAQRDVATAQSALQNSQNNLDTVTKQQAQAVANALHNLLTSGLTAVINNEFAYTTANVTNASAPVITGSYGGSATGTYHIVQQGSYFSVNGLEDQAMQKFDTRVPVALGTQGLYVQLPNDQISAEWNVDIPNQAGSNYLSNYNAYQSALLTQKQQLSNAQNSLISAQSSLQKAQDTLTTKQEPPQDSDIAQAKSQLINAQSNLRNAQNNYNNTKITAPFDGEIAAVNSQIGDQVSGSTVIATLITQQKIAEITLNEVDAAKVKVGDQATLTFDAVPDLTITGKVAQIDLLGTVTQGVVNYGVQIAFDTQDTRVRPDMSVTASIITDTKTDVIAVPNSAIKTIGTTSYVQTVDANNIASTDSSGAVTLKSDSRQTVVQIGISNDSYTEITSGLSGGENVITRTISSAKSSSSGSNSSVRLPGIGGGGGNRGFGG